MPGRDWRCAGGGQRNRTQLAYRGWPIGQNLQEAAEAGKLEVGQSEPPQTVPGNLNQVAQIDPPENKVGYQKPPPQKKGLRRTRQKKQGFDEGFYQNRHLLRDR